MNPYKIKKVKKLLKRMQNAPLVGPDLDDAFYIFAVQSYYKKVKCGKI